MSEKKQLEGTLELLESFDGKAFHRFKVRIILIVVLVIALGAIAFNSGNYSLITGLFFILGICFSKWESLYRLNIMLPHINK